MPLNFEAVVPTILDGIVNQDEIDDPLMDKKIVSPKIRAKFSGHKWQEAVPEILGSLKKDNINRIVDGLKSDLQNVK